MDCIYLDNNATTPTDPLVLEAMKQYFCKDYGNPSSGTHQSGRKAKEAIDQARHSVAKLMNATAEEIIFTSGATESNNIAILGLTRALKGQTPHIITANTEHKAVLDVCHMATECGAEITVLEVNSQGQVTAEQVEAAIKPNTKLMTLMAANNEVGTLHPIKAIGKIAKKHNVLFHTDAAQAAGKIELDVDEMNIDLLSISGHKMYAPKGIGALYVRKGTPLMPIMGGGQQEKGLRPGTHNVPAIIGLAKACDLCIDEIEAETSRLTALRDLLINEVLLAFPSAQLNGHPIQRLCNNISVTINDVDPSLASLYMSGIAYSSTSACNSTGGLSHVLEALGLDSLASSKTMRFGLGRFTKESEVQACIEKLKKLKPSQKVASSQ